MDFGCIDFDIENLIGRKEFVFDKAELLPIFAGKTVMVTGGGGSIGSELCRALYNLNIDKLIILDFYENNAYAISQELLLKGYSPKIVVEIANLREYDKIDYIFAKHKPDIVFNAGAHKHVPLMEDCPDEAVKNNILGTLNVIKLADKYNVKRFVQISTDKAVNPTSVMGATKLVDEYLISYYAKRSKTVYTAVRFGNVFNSNGSVVPLFISQIRAGGPVTVTDKNIERFFMTIPEAVSLILKTCTFIDSDKIYVLDMGKPVNIYDLAIKLIKSFSLKPDVDIKIKITGLRPGEKLTEECFYKQEDLSITPDGRITVLKEKSFDEVGFYNKVLELIDLSLKTPIGVKEKLFDLINVLNKNTKI